MSPLLHAAELARDLAELGVARGDVLLVHTSLKAIAGGRVILGGAIAVIEALQEAVGPEGTIAMPAFSADYSEPSHWTAPPAPESWWETIRAHWPAFRKDRTPTFRIGTVAEQFRGHADVERGEHPTSSFSAWGAQATFVVGAHPLDDPLGEGSPLGRLEELNAAVLLIGAPWRSCTTFHLGESRARNGPAAIRQGAPVFRDGRRAWVEYDDRAWSADDFDSLGRDFEMETPPMRGRVGEASATRFALRDGASFAKRWIETHR